MKKHTYKVLAMKQTKKFGEVEKYEGISYLTKKEVNDITDAFKDQGYQTIIFVKLAHLDK